MSRLLHLFAALALLLAFVWDNAGSSCMEGLHHWHRGQQQRRLSRIVADTLRMPVGEYCSLTARDKREISYHGRMYDVHSATIVGSEVVLAGHYDDFDGELFKILDKLLDDESGTQGDRQLRLFFFTAVLPEPCIWTHTLLRDAFPEYYTAGPMRTPSAVQEVPIAPPEAGV